MILAQRDAEPVFRHLKSLRASRRQYSGFLLATVVVLVLHNSLWMTVALAIHAVIWVAVVFAVSSDIRDADAAWAETVSPVTVPDDET